MTQVSAQQAFLTTDISNQPITVNKDQLLWQYHSKGTIAGIKVNQKDLDLNIDRQDQLLDAFQMDQDLMVWSGWLSPQHKQHLKQYQQIKRKQLAGQYQILDQNKQYSMNKDAYLAVIVYAKVEFKLNDRYSFYRQDIIHE